MANFETWFWNFEEICRNFWIASEASTSVRFSSIVRQNFSSSFNEHFNKTSKILNFYFHPTFNPQILQNTAKEPSNLPTKPRSLPSSQSQSSNQEIIQHLMTLLLCHKELCSRTKLACDLSQFLLSFLFLHQHNCSVQFRGEKQHSKESFPDIEKRIQCLARQKESWIQGKVKSSATLRLEVSCAVVLRWRENEETRRKVNEPFSPGGFARSRIRRPKKLLQMCECWKFVRSLRGMRKWFQMEMLYYARRLLKRFVEMK
jgi:YesN/AraC family two-component response regulator